ncbi:MAG: hypothetical protein ACYDBO_02200 [Vulcanimicrobiaceae bacterium]
MREPRFGSVDIVASSALGKEIDAFAKSFTQNQFMRFTEAAKGKTGSGNLKVPYGALSKGVSSEQAIMAGLGWYWEPLLHDLAFLEQMRDTISVLAGGYQKFTDLVMEGFDVQGNDPQAVKAVQDEWMDDARVDFREVVRSTIFELLTLANSYRRPIWNRNDKGQFALRTFVPVRATAVRKLRDADLVTEGYVQLLHRPSEFIFGGTPQTPTVYLADEMICGIAFTDGWYAYGKPPLASMPFIIRIKLQMERDLAEMFHQHVPRIDITYTPDDQMNQEQVDDAVKKLSGQIAALKSTDNFIHTPDSVVDYKGPMGHALDPTGAQNHIEDQIYAVLPLGPGILGRDVTANPMLSTQQWRLTCAMVNHIRARAYIMHKPALKRFCDERGFTDVPKYTWTNLDSETAEQNARTNEYSIANATAQRDAGYISQDDAAKKATAHHPEGPVKKAAKPGPISPPVNPDNAATPGSGARPKVGDSKKGPSGPNRNAPTPDKRPKGKRHEDFVEFLAGLAEWAHTRLGIVDEGTDSATETEN